MTEYQGSDWFKSGVHLKYVVQDDRQQLVAQATQQISDCSKQLQLAYDGGLALFSDFTGTDAQVQRAQETLAAITAVQRSLQELHKRLAPSLTHASSESSVDYIPSGTQHQDADGLALLKAKEEQLQKEVNRCRCLTAENDLLQKQLQGLRAASNAGSDMYAKTRLHSDSIRAGQNSTAWLNSVEDLSCTDGNNQSVTLDGVKSLMHAGSWLQMLRAKLAGSSYRQQPGQDGTDMDDTASLPGTRASEEYAEQEPMRRSQSDQLFDRDTMRRSSRRGGELVRESGPWSDLLTSPIDRDRRRRTNVFMEDVEPSHQNQADLVPVRHFLTPELAARSALFKGRS